MKKIGIFEMQYNAENRLAQLIFKESRKDIMHYCYNSRIYLPPRPSNLSFYVRNKFKLIFYFPNIFLFFRIIFNYLKLVIKIKTKNDLIKLKINNIHIGDLIYDTIIRDYYVPTVNIGQFKTYFKIFTCISKFYFWEDYIKKNRENISYFVGSHTNYSLGIPLRLAIFNNVSVYIVNIETIYYLSKKNLHVGFHSVGFHKKIYQKIKNKKKAYKIGLQEFKRRIIKGEGYDLPPIFERTFSKKNINLKVLKKSSKLIGLIALHDFYDSPNAKGRFLFNDFYEWFCWFAKYSHSNNKIHWIIKKHPMSLQPNKEDEICNKIVKEFKNCTLVPRNTSHKSLLEVVDFAISCRGTIGYEYSYFKKPVFLMNTNNHNYVDYNFVIKFSNKQKLKNLLDNIKLTIKNHKISKKEIINFFYTHYIGMQSSNWLVPNYSKAFNKFYLKNDPKSQKLKPKILRILEKKLKDKAFIKEKTKIVNNFKNSKDIKLIYK